MEHRIAIDRHRIVIDQLFPDKEPKKSEGLLVVDPAEEEKSKKSIVLCTVATSRNTWLDQWEASARKFGWNYHILGMGHTWEGFQTKVRLVRNFCAEQDGDVLVCVTDSYDLIMSGPPAELVQKYRNLPQEKSIVVGAEGRVGPNSPKIHHMDAFPDEDKRNLNMGFIVGRARELSEVYAFALERCPHDDQIGVGAMINMPDEHRFHLDSAQSFVLNLNFPEEVKDVKLISGSRVRWQKSNVTPLAVHLPFMHLDLAYRSNYVRSHVLDEFTPTPKLESAQLLIKHMCREAWHNPAYRWLQRGTWVLFICTTFFNVHAARYFILDEDEGGCSIVDADMTRACVRGVSYGFASIIPGFFATLAGAQPKKKKECAEIALLITILTTAYVLIFACLAMSFAWIWHVFYD